MVVAREFCSLIHCCAAQNLKLSKKYRNLYFEQHQTRCLDINQTCQFDQMYEYWTTTFWNPLNFKSIWEGVEYTLRGNGEHGIHTGIVAG